MLGTRVSADRHGSERQTRQVTTGLLSALMMLLPHIKKGVNQKPLAPTVGSLIGSHRLVDHKWESRSLRVLIQ